MSAASLAPSLRSRAIPMRATARQASGPPPAATVLYDDKAIALHVIRRDPKQPKDALWVRKRDLPSINEF